MSGMRWLGRKIGIVLWAAILGFAIALIPQGLWSALVVANLRTGTAIPWAVPLMAILLWLMLLYLSGRWAPRRTSDTRRNSLRLRRISMRAFTWAVVAGALSIVALDGLWIVMARMVRMPGSVLPDMSNYPRLTVVAMVTMGVLVSPICEQAGIWGYCQTRLERNQRTASTHGLRLTSHRWSCLQRLQSWRSCDCQGSLPNRQRRSALRLGCRTATVR